MPSHVFRNASDARNYALAGKSTLTLSSLRTGVRYTYKVSVPREPSRNGPVWFVKLLTGPSNTSNYTYIGMIGSDGELKPTRKSRMTADSVPMKAFNYFLAHTACNVLPPQLEVRHEGSCGRCGRKLTVPSSIDAGIGPECARRM